MLQVNQSVVSKKYGKGVIETIITKSTGYVEVRYENGTLRKEMAFNLTDENGTPLRKAPKKVEPTVTPLQEAIFQLQGVNGLVRGDRSSLSYQLYEKKISSIEIAAQEAGNDFIASVCNSVIKYTKCSDKQAYCLAKFAIDNNIEL